MVDSERYINSISRAIKILKLYSKEKTELGVLEIAQALKLHQTTVFRIVRTLKNEGWLIQDRKNGKYVLGLGVLDIANSVKRQYSYRDIIVDEMKTLMQEINEDVILSVCLGTEGYCVEKIDSLNQIKLTSKAGNRVPLHCGATGKILLAYQPQDVIDKVLQTEFIKFTERTKTTKEELIKDLCEIRENGYVISIAELDEDALGLGAPIFDSDGRLLYGLSIAGAINRINNKGVDILKNKMLRSCKSIMEKLRSLGN